MNPTVIFLNIPANSCGVFQHGLAIFNILKESKKYNFVYRESPESLLESHDLSITNFHELISRPILDITTNSPKLAILHEIGELSTDSVDSFANYFDGLILGEPNSPINHPKLHKTVRPLRNGPLLPITPEISIGFFGFPFPHKRIELVAALVAQEFERASIRLHISPSYHGLPKSPKEIIEELNNIVKNENVHIDINYDYVDDSEIVSWLSQNHLNIFLYDDSLRPLPKGRHGIASSTDYAVGAIRPILLSHSEQFRHMPNIPRYPEISLKQAIEMGNDEVCKLANEWANERFLKQHEDILDRYYDNLDRYDG